MALTIQQQQTFRNFRRHRDDVQRLEQSVTDLGDMFIEMDKLVQEQEKDILTIEQHVERTVDHVDNAEKQVQTAVVYAKRSRRRKWCLLVVTLVLLATIAIILYFVLEPMINEVEQN